jgi:UDP-N-acetylglucosamine 4,6-dehydratase
MFVVKPNFHWWKQGHWEEGTAVPAGFRYTSDANDRWLTPPDIRALAVPA